MKSVCQFSCSTALVLVSFALAFGQQPPQAPAAAKEKTQATAPKKSVVWTDDNITSLRSPSDAYEMQQQDEKSEAAQVATQKPAATAHDDSQNGRPIPEAKTVQQADDLIAHDKQEIQGQQDYIRQTQQELATATDSYKARLGWRIQSHTNIINNLQNEMSAIEKQRDALAKQPSASASPKATEQPPSQ